MRWLISMNNKKPTTNAVPPRSPGRPRLVNLLRSLFTSHTWLAWGILIASLFITALIALYFKTNVEHLAQHEFDFVCNEIQLNIETDWLPAPRSSTAALDYLTYQSPPRAHNGKITPGISRSTSSYPVFRASALRN